MSALLAQSRYGYNPSEGRPYYIGLSFGLGLQGISLSNSPNSGGSRQALSAEQEAYQVGLSIGLVSGLRLHPNWELRSIPSLHLGRMRLAYWAEVDPLEQVDLTNNYLFLPLQVKWASDRLNHIRPYIVVGPYASWFFSRDKNALLLPPSLGYGLSFSLGCELFWGTIKFSPELSYTYGLNEAIRYNRPELPPHRLQYTSAIKRSRAHQIGLSIHIQ